MTKARFQPWKELENLREKFQRPKDAVKPLSAITWKVKISIEQENWLAGQKNNYHNSRIVHKVKKENFVNIKNIEISSGCSLQY